MAADLPHTQLDSYAELYESSGPYAEFERETRSGGTFGLKVLSVNQGAVEAVDPALPEFAIVSSPGTQGTGEFDFGDGWTPFRAGRPFVDVQPVHTACRFRLPSMHLKIVTIPEAAIVEHLETFGLGAGKLDGVSGVMRELPEAARLVDVLWHASLRPSPETNLILDGAFLQLLGQLVSAASNRTVENATAGVGDHRLLRAIDYLETHIEQPLTVGELARVAAMSTSAFARSFRTATGRTVWSYVRLRRVERAHGLILNTRLSLAQIAAACGFSDAAHLSRVFRAVYGMAPKDAR